MAVSHWLPIWLRVFGPPVPSRRAFSYETQEIFAIKMTVPIGGLLRGDRDRKFIVTRQRLPEKG